MIKRFKCWLRGHAWKQAGTRFETSSGGCFTFWFLRQRCECCGAYREVKLP